jgi:predicted nucleic acid-binding protein
MIVVADASPLNYLIQISCDNLIRDLYRTVLVPASVMEELGHPLAPASEAKRRGISTRGTVGILLAGGKRRLIEPEVAFRQLIGQTNFRATPKLIESFTEQCREFRQRT